MKLIVLDFFCVRFWAWVVVALWEVGCPSRFSVVETHFSLCELCWCYMDQYHKLQSRHTHVLKIVSYNPMAANYERLLSIMQELQATHIIGLAGTARKWVHEFGPCKKSSINNFTTYEWGWTCSHPGLNKACGTMLCINNSVLPAHCLNAVYSPPPNLQGRGGAVRYKTTHFDILAMVLYLAPNTHSKFHNCNRKLLSWALTMRKKCPLDVKSSSLSMPTLESVPPHLVYKRTPLFCWTHATGEGKHKWSSLQRVSVRCTTRCSQYAFHVWAHLLWRKIHL